MPTFKITKGLKDLLSDKQLEILKAYLSNCTLRDISRRLNVKQDDILLEFIFLGKKLALYEMSTCRVLLDLTKVGEKGYVSGFKDFRKQLYKEVEYVRIKEGKKRLNRKSNKKK